MRIARDVLERFTDLPTDNRQVRLLMDDVGLEVKRIEDSSGPLVYHLELLANRGDHHAYLGVAREITGRTGLPLRTVSTASLTIDPTGYPLEVRSDKLLRYSATVLDRVSPPRALGTEALRVLDAAGIHSISAPVDATNIANLELGQPTHVFDAAKVAGPIVIRESVSGEKAWPLFAEEHIELPEGTLVIADSEKVLAIAGVIGCEDSKATAESEPIILESAAFDPISVRKASRALDIHTDSSARFERGSDPNMVLVGAGRVVELLESAGWQRAGGTSIVGPWTDPERTIPLDVARANAFLGSELLVDEMADILGRYGFSCAPLDGGLSVRVPTWRLWDVQEVADLHEELAKAVGYNALPTTLPTIDRGSLPLEREQIRDQVEEVLLGAGFYECITDGFYSRSVRDLLGLDESHPLWDHVGTTNAIDRAYGMLKNNCLAQAVEAAAFNLNQRESDVKLYEWTRVFIPRPTDGNKSPCVEERLLWGLSMGTDQPSWAGTGRPADPHFLKGVIHEIGVELGLDLVIAGPDPKHRLHTCMHPGRYASVTLDGRTIGVFGEVHPAIVARAKIKRARPCYFELRTDALFAPGSRPAFTPPPVEQPMERTLAFALPNGIEADAVGAWMHASGPDWLETVDILDRFDFDEDDVSLRAITYGLRFTAGPSADEVNQALDDLVTAVDAQFGSAGVRQR